MISETQISTLIDLCEKLLPENGKCSVELYTVQNDWCLQISKYIIEDGSDKYSLVLSHNKNRKVIFVRVCPNISKCVQECLTWLKESSVSMANIEKQMLQVLDREIDELTCSLEQKKHSKPPKVQRVIDLVNIQLSASAAKDDINSEV